MPYSAIRNTRKTLNRRLRFFFLIIWKKRFIYSILLYEQFFFLKANGQAVSCQIDY